MQIRKLHFVGIGGSGISGVADLAEKMGYEVSGCDLEKTSAYKKNIVQGHSPSHLKNIDLVIVSPALLFQDKENTEIIEARKQNKLMTWQEFLGKILLKDKKLICVAGTHGKSTTTAMAGKLLIDNGFDPIVVLGAVVPEWGGTSRHGKGEYAIVEADEFNNNFLNYHPEIAIINNIEFDHPDFFKNETEVEESFKKFLSNLNKNGIVIANWNAPEIKRLDLIRRDLLKVPPLQKRFNLKLFGDHNQKNSNMVYLLGKTLGIDENKIIESIENFNGIGRRMELIADRGGIKVYDDYAHHPTAIANTLDGVREKFPKARILVICEPHGYMRTKALLPLYKDAFKDADKAIIGPIFQARDIIDESITPELVAKTSGHNNAIGLNSFEKVIENCKLEIGSYDIVVVMGAGKSYLWAREIASLIPVKFSDLTTFKLGGQIKKYVEIKNKGDIPEIISGAKKERLSIFIIGGGSDILVSDKEFEGLAIKYVGNTISFGGRGTVTAEAGVDWDKLVEESVENDLQGIECLSGIPGTVGGAPIQNIGAYGAELSDVFESLEAFDIDKEKFVTFSKEDCKFGYRESVFKQKDHWQKYLICNVTLKLVKNGKPKADYESLKKRITSSSPTLSEIRNAVLATRAEKLEDPKVVANAGSFFMNPIINSNEKIRLESVFPDIKIFPFGDKFKASAGWLIEKAGWKGKSFRTAGVSEKHALILINKDGKAKANDVFDLSEKIIEDVYKKFGLKLEREVQFINF